MSSFARYAIENGWDPVLSSDGTPWDGDRSPYSDEPIDFWGDDKKKNHNYRVSNNNLTSKQTVYFGNFQEAWNFSKLHAPSSLKRSGEGFVVIYD